MKRRLVSEGKRKEQEQKRNTFEENLDKRSEVISADNFNKDSVN
jgi:hypothetical protein